MTRQHKTQWFPNSNLRSLQAQIDELWEVVQHLRDHPSLPIGLDNLKTMGEVLAEAQSPSQVNDGARALTAAVATDHDAHAEQVVAEVADELKPDAYEIKAMGYGWFQVVDKSGKPIHEGKLRKDKAQEVWQAAMEGV